MHVLISILLIFALIFGAIKMMPDSWFQDDPVVEEPGDENQNPPIQDGTADSDVNITTSTIAIDIVDGEGNSLKGQTLLFEGELTGGEILFQPGALVYTQGFKIKNNSNVPATFKMNVTKSEDADVEAFHQGFNYYVITSLTDLRPTEKLIEYTGLLAPGQSSEMFYIVVSMKPEADNAFQNRTFEGLGVHVIASQLRTED